MGELIDIVMPDSDQEGTKSIVANWLKTPGDAVSLHEPLLEINTDKVTIEVPAPASGVLREIRRQANEEVHAGEILGCLELIATGRSERQQQTSQSDRNTHQQMVDSGTSGQTEELSPAVRRLLKENNLHAQEIQGTGKGGRITHADVERYLSLKQSGRNSKGEVQDVRIVPHTQMRKTIAEHMVLSALKTAPHVTAVFEVDFTSIISHREHHKNQFEKDGVRLTYTPYFLRAICEAVKAVPDVNSRFTDTHLEVYNNINIGVATAIEGGLVVPVVSGAQDCSLRELAQKLEDLTRRARSNELRPEEVRNGTITITNHGVSGSLLATPVINQPQSAIVGIGKVEKRVVVREKNGRDEMEIRPMAYVTLTIDHRALDGFQANTFLAKFVEFLEGENFS